MNDKTRVKEKTYIWVSVRWKPKSYSWGIYTSRLHWVVRGTGTPKPRIETSIFKTRQSVVLRMLLISGLNCEDHSARWWWNWPLVDCGRWTPEAVKNRSVSRLSCKNRSHTNWRCILPDVLTIGDIQEMTWEGLLSKVHPGHRVDFGNTGVDLERNSSTSKANK